ncbi:DUF4099 domain-containing protein [uncultured Duncaniella sp.]|uniref:DUF4099 domain-containing protein n=1 Tax=uncultured Duncaniella sp. TaxID=2768039 RepID=UPI000F486E39|nr:DUF4099 domain-containing protein [uncultured Duncaniella sp.]ROT07997.1 DUF4099 domain-containing protein [Muribaculaceae bacterium Isolate-037 (Harlan)]
MNQSQFTEEEIPYHILNRFGLTREMIEDLPEGLGQRLRDGRTTPVLPIKVIADNGDTILAAARLSLHRNSDGDVRVMFYPRLEKIDLSRFPEAQRKPISGGETVISEISLPDGKRAPAFYQIDSETNQVMAVPVAVVDNNIRVIADELRLTPAEVNCLRNGKLLTTQYQDKMWTIGVSLREQPGIRVVCGDEDTWREDDRRDYGKFNFGLNGCWISNDEGGLDYVPEDEYTEELWDEMKKRGNMQRNASTHKM